MTPTKNQRKIASSLILVSILVNISLTYATPENNYNNDTNLLSDLSESTYTENGYKANVIINPHTTGIYANENGYKLDLTINTQGIGGSLKENNYKLDLTPEKTFPDPSDVAVTKIATSKTIVGQGYSILINVTLSNQALNYETFCITISVNTTTIKTQTVTLTSGKSTTIAFFWTTTGFAKGNYIISACATPVSGEADTGDNHYTDGWILITKAGDFGTISGGYYDFDGFCDYQDLFLFRKAYVGEYEDLCDFDNNHGVDYLDLFQFRKCYVTP